MIVDILVGAVLLVSAVISFLRGFIREVLTITGVLGGLVAAYFGAPVLSPVVQGWFGVEEDPEKVQKLFDFIPLAQAANVITYAAIFIIVVIVLSIISHFLAEAVKTVGLGAIDRTLGVIFGVLRGALLLGLLYLPVQMAVSQETKESWFEGSRSYIYLEKVSGWIGGFFSDEQIQQVGDDARKFGDVLDTRKKLEEMNLLRKKAEEGPLSEEEVKKLQGYNEEFRNSMDQLIEQEQGVEQYNE